jgi:hypothetical protein
MDDPTPQNDPAPPAPEPPADVRGVTVGYASCPNCGARCAVKANKKGHLYIYCPAPLDGGCFSGTTSRSDKGDGLIARRVTEWRNAELKAKYLALAPARAEPSPAPAPAPAPSPAPRKPPVKKSAKEKTPWYDREII